MQPALKWFKTNNQIWRERIIQAEGKMCKGPKTGKTQCFLETERKKAWLGQLKKGNVGSMRDEKKIFTF